jgi:uncharacterized YccA/Bax inhibitor family protein
MAIKSGNPALNKKTFDNLPPGFFNEAMTLDGVTSKSLILFALCVGSGFFGWNLASQNHPLIGAFILGSIIAAFIVALITIFKKTVSPYTSPIYAVLEGFALGAISQFYEKAFEGIVLQALLLTGGIFVSMLLLYRFRIIRATENFKLGIVAATGGIALYYLANLVINFFGKDLPLIAINSVYGIGFTVIVIVIAALNLVIDFDFIEKGVEQKAPKYMEWYASFGLLVTLVWLYLEILRLLSKLRSR